MLGNIDYTKRTPKSNLTAPYWILKCDRESLVKIRKLFEDLFGEPFGGRACLST